MSDKRVQSRRSVGEPVQHIRQQAAVAQLGVRALTSQSIDELMEDVVLVVKDVLAVDYAQVLAYSPDLNAFELQAGLGWEDGLVGTATVSADAGSQAGYTLQSSEPVVVRNLREETRFTGPALLLDHDVVSGISVAIGDPQHPYGVLGAHTRTERIFSQEEVYFLQSVSNILAAAIHRLRAEHGLQALNEDLEMRVKQRTGLMRLLQEVTLAVNEATSISEAMQFALAKVCEFTAWQVGHVYTTSPDDPDTLIPTSIWHLTDGDRFNALQKSTRATTFRKGSGLPGRVLAGGKPEWITDLSGDRFDRLEAAQAAGLQSSAGFPVLAGREVVAVLEFFADEPVVPEAPLLDVLANIGTQLGRVVERRRAEERIHARQQQLMEAQAVARFGSWEWDTQRDEVSWSDEMYRIYGLDPDVFNASYDGFLERVHPEDRERVDEIIQTAYREARPFEFEHRIVLPDGRVKTLQARGRVFLGTDGTPERMSGTGLDITERKLMEEALRESNLLFENLFQSAPDAILLVDRDGRIRKANSQAEAVFGYALEELLEKRIESLVPRRHRETHAQYRAAYYEAPTRRPMGVGLKLDGLRKDHSEFPVDITLSPVITKQGLLVMSVVRDMTERQEAQSRIRSEAELRKRMVEAAPLILWSAGLDGNITLLEGKGLDLLELDAEEIIGTSLLARITEQEEIYDYIQRAMQGETISAEIETDERALDTRLSPIWNDAGEIEGVTGVSLDITDRVRTERQLRESEERYRQVIDSVKDYAIFSVDPEGRITSWNAGAERVKGYSADEVLGMSIAAFYPEGRRQQGYPGKALETAARRGKYEEEGWRVKKDGTMFWASVVISPIRDSQGELQGFSKVVYDLTDRKQAEEALRESESRFRAVFEHGAVGIFILDLSQRLLIANPAFQRMTGYPLSELHGMKFNRLLAPGDSGLEANWMDAVLAGKNDSITKEIRLERQDGNTAFVSLSMTATRYPDDTPRFVVCLAEDITVRRLMESELAEVQRELVASREKERLLLAQELHDEPLQELYGLLYQIEAFVSDLNETYDAREVQEMVGTINGVINDLRAICGELRPPALAPFGLEGALREHAEQFKEDNPEIAVHLDLQYDGQLLQEDMRLHLYRIYQQAMSNVVRHARAENVYVDFGFDERTVRLEIRDDGAGFQVPVRWVTFVREEHLGLAGAAERAELMDGYFEVTSEPGSGTTVRVTVPRFAE